MNITFFGTYNTTTTPRIQVLIEGFEANDYNLYECNVPLQLNTNQRVAILKAPWRIPQLIAKVCFCWLKLIVKRRRVPKSKAVLIGHLGHFDIHLASILFPSRHLILDYMISAGDTARDRGVRGGWKLKVLTWLDNSALKKADTIIVDTEEQRSTIPAKYREKTVIVYVGASNEWFDGAKRQVSGSPLRIIFFGSYTPLQGAPIIGQSLSMLKERVHVTMIGNGQDEESTKLAASLKKDSVTIDWLDWPKRSELLNKVVTSDVCLGIFGAGPKALRVVPNKIYQGAAAGCALITSATPPQQRILGDAALFVSPDDPKALALAIDGLARDRTQLHELQNKASRLARSDFKPQIIVAPLLKSLEAISN